MKVTAPCRKKARAEQRRIRQNQPPVSSAEARRQFERVLKGFSQYRAEYQSLIAWADQTGRRGPSSFIKQFDFVGEGAEHRVYKKAAADSLAIKSMLPNKFGYSIQREGEWASPVE